MEYTVFLLLLIALVASPFLLWIHLTRGRWRRPQRAMKVVVAVATVLVFGASAAYGYLYPYGRPGAEMPGWRAMGDVCIAAYAEARTAGDSAAVDALHPVTDVADPNSVLSCGTMRSNRLLGCRPGSRCARIKSMLRLPGG